MKKLKNSFASLFCFALLVSLASNADAKELFKSGNFSVSNLDDLRTFAYKVFDEDSGYDVLQSPQNLPEYKLQGLEDVFPVPSENTYQFHLEMKLANEIEAPKSYLRKVPQLKQARNRAGQFTGYDITIPEGCFSDTFALDLNPDNWGTKYPRAEYVEKVYFQIHDVAEYLKNLRFLTRGEDRRLYSIRHVKICSIDKHPNPEIAHRDGFPYRGAEDPEISRKEKEDRPVTLDFQSATGTLWVYMQAYNAKSNKLNELWNRGDFFRGLNILTDILSAIEKEKPGSKLAKALEGSKEKLESLNKVLWYLVNPTSELSLSLSRLMDQWNQKSQTEGLVIPRNLDMMKDSDHKKTLRQYLRQSKLSEARQLIARELEALSSDERNHLRANLNSYWRKNSEEMKSLQDDNGGLDEVDLHLFTQLTRQKLQSIEFWSQVKSLGTYLQVRKGMSLLFPQSTKISLTQRSTPGEDKDGVTLFGGLVLPFAGGFGYAGTDGPVNVGNYKAIHAMVGSFVAPPPSELKDLVELALEREKANQSQDEITIVQEGSVNVFPIDNIKAVLDLSNFSIGLPDVEEFAVKESLEAIGY